MTGQGPADHCLSPRLESWSRRSPGRILSQADKRGRGTVTSGTDILLLQYLVARRQVRPPQATRDSPEYWGRKKCGSPPLRKSRVPARFLSALATGNALSEQVEHAGFGVETRSTAEHKTVRMVAVTAPCNRSCLLVRKAEAAHGERQVRIPQIVQGQDVFRRPGGSRPGQDQILRRSATAVCDMYRVVHPDARAAVWHIRGCLPGSTRRCLGVVADKSPTLPAPPRGGRWRRTRARPNHHQRANSAGKQWYTATTAS